MNILVTGVGGQLGHDVVKILNKLNIKNVGIDISDLDLTDEKAIINYFSVRTFAAIIHCAAYTDVDKAQSENDKCFNVNVNATKYLVNIARENNMKFMYISTDYIFNSDCEESLEIHSKKRDLSDSTNIYGISKLHGENIVKEYERHFIVRTSWVFGANGHNFINTMINLSQSKNEISVISDQFGSPTYTSDLSVLLIDMIQTEKYGVYHATNEGTTNWNSFAKEIFNLIGKDMTINEILTSEYKTDASRPLNSRLSKKTLLDNGFDLLPTWQDALKRYLKEKGEL